MIRVKSLQISSLSLRGRCQWLTAYLEQTVVVQVKFDLIYFRSLETTDLVFNAV
jgi:hypothetical protein